MKIIVQVQKGDTALSLENFLNAVNQHYPQHEIVVDVKKVNRDDRSFYEKIRDEEVKTELAKAANLLNEYCAGLAREAGWDLKPREHGTEFMLMVSEISEAMEGDRKNLMDDHLPHRKMVDVELGDAVIRICHYAGREGIDLGTAIVDKLIYNTERPDHKLENRAKENGKAY